MNKWIDAWVLSVIAVALEVCIYGLWAPRLISESSDLAVTVGLTLMFIIGPILGLAFYKIIRWRIKAK